MVGFAWYSREQWRALTKVVPDRSELDDTYEAWEAQAVDVLETFAAQGVQAIKVPVDVEELVAWCEAHGLPVNGEGRAQFANHLLANMFQRG